MSMRSLMREVNKDGNLYKILGVLALAAAAALLIVIVFDIVTNKPEPEPTAKLEVSEELRELIRLRQELQDARAALADKLSDAQTSEEVVLVDTPPPPRSELPKRTASSSSLLFVDYSKANAPFKDVSTSPQNAYIPAGAVFQAKLLTPIKTSVQRSFVLAEVTKDFRMDPQRQIRKGSRLLGGARLNNILKGVIVNFDLLVDPEGIEHQIDAIALSENALPELEGLYFSDELERYSAALAFGFISGLSDAAQEQEYSVFGSRPRVTVENQLLNGLSRASFQVAESLLRDLREQGIEYVVIPSGEHIFVALQRRYEINQTTDRGQK